VDSGRKRKRELTYKHLPSLGFFVTLHFQSFPGKNDIKEERRGRGREYNQRCNGSGEDNVETLLEFDVEQDRIHIGHVPCGKEAV
jgi:hypothetical protein